MHVRDGNWPGAVADVRGRHQCRGTAGGPGPRPGPVGPAGTGRRQRGRRPDALSDVLERDQRVPAGALGGVQPGPAPQDWQGLRPAVRGSAIPAAALEGGAGAGIGCQIDGRRSPARRAGWAGAGSAGRPVRAEAWAGARRMAPARPPRLEAGVLATGGGRARFAAFTSIDGSCCDSGAAQLSALFGEQL